MKKMPKKMMKFLNEHPIDPDRFVKALNDCGDHCEKPNDPDFIDLDDPTLRKVVIRDFEEKGEDVTITPNDTPLNRFMFRALRLHFSDDSDEVKQSFMFRATMLSDVYDDLKRTNNVDDETIFKVAAQCPFCRTGFDLTHFKKLLNSSQN